MTNIALLIRYGILTVCGWALMGLSLAFYATPHSWLGVCALICFVASLGVRIAMSGNKR